MTVFVYVNDVIIAAQRWADISTSGIALCEFLGLDPEDPTVTRDTPFDMWSFSDEAANRVRLLNGPHHRTIIKTFEARNEKARNNITARLPARRPQVG